MKVRLKRVRGEAVGPDVHEFTTNGTIGRSPDADMVINHLEISLRHCRIEISTEEEMAKLRGMGYRGDPIVAVHDEESAKGTFINGNLLHDDAGHRPCGRIVDGDVITLARVVTYAVTFVNE